MSIKLAEIVRMIQIIDSGELKISGERQVILGLETFKNSIVKSINEVFKEHDIDENNVNEFILTPIKE